MREATCTCCARPLRRKLVGGAIAAVASGIAEVALAQSELLNPFAPVKPRQAAAPPSPDASDASAPVHSSSRAAFPISEPRSMGERTASAIADLCRRATELVAQRDKLRDEIASLVAKRQQLVAAKEAEMEDYRNGLFCSGCNRTKRDIISSGDTFPHPGQRIIAPTPEQIARKDAELQRPIDRASTELDKQRKEVDLLDAMRNDAQDQVKHGISLWEASVGYERALIWRETDKRLGKLQAELQQIQATLSDLRSREFRTKQAAEQRLIGEERRMWESVQRKRQQAMQDERSSLQQASAAADRVRVDEQQRIMQVMNSSKIGVYGTPNLGGRAAMLDANSLGVRFRMGKLLSRSDIGSGVQEILPSVERFVLSYKQNG